MYNLVPSSMIRRSRFKTSIDDSEKVPTKGLMKLIEKRTDKVRVVRIESDEGLYESNIKPLLMDKYCVTQTDLSYLWHNRLGHVNTKTLNQTLPNYVEVTISRVSENLPSCGA